MLLNIIHNIDYLYTNKTIQELLKWIIKNNSKNESVEEKYQNPNLRPLILDLSFSQLRLICTHIVHWTNYSNILFILCSDKSRPGPEIFRYYCYMTFS